MTLWFLLAAAMIVQEPISASAVLLSAYQSHYNLWLIHLLFSAATIFDIVVTYYLGIFISRKYSHWRIIIYLKGKFETISSFMGKRGKIAALIVAVPLLFPVSGIIVPWLGVTCLEALVFVFIGEWIFWYGYEWLLVLGASTFARDSHFALYVVIGFSIIISIGLRAVSKRIGKTAKEAK